MTLGTSIKRWRKRRGLTLLQAAIALGVQPSTVKRWEDGDMEPKGLSLERIQEVLKGE